MSTPKQPSSPTETQVKMPFNLYDIFGYIIPGAYFSLVLTLVSFKSNGRLANMIANSIELLFRPDNTLSSIFGFSIILVLCYMVGHMVASISHIVFDRFIVGGVLTYPTEKVLRYNVDKDYARPYLRSTYLYVCCLTIFLLSYPAIMFLLDWRLVQMDPISCANVIRPLCLPRWHMIISCIVLSIALIRFVYQYFSNIFGAEKVHDALDCKLVRWGILVYAFIPRYLFLPAISMYESLIGTNRYFHPELIRQYEVKFKKDFSIDAKTAQSENYWLPLIHIAERGKAMNQSLTNWLQLYGFNRNMAAAGLLASFYCIWKLHIDGVPNIEFIAGVYTVNVIVLFAFMTRYWMLYVTYYTKSIIRTYLVD